MIDPVGIGMTLVVVVLSLVPVVLILVGLYWAVRLGVRHGRQDSDALLSRRPDDRTDTAGHHL